MCQLCPIRILPIFVAIDGHAAEMELVHRETGNFYIGQRIFKYYRAIAATGLQLMAKLVNIIWREVNNRRELLQQGVHIADFIRRNRNVVPGDISYQRDTVAIINDTARWGDGQHFDVVCIRSGGVILVLTDL